MRHIVRAGASSLLALCYAGTAPAQPATAASAQPRAQESGAAPAPEGLGDIVVTAQRREERLQQVPISISAFDASAIADRRITTIQSLDGIAPSITITTQAQAPSPAINLRGIGSGASQASIDPKVAIYLDGVYIGRSVGAIFGLADIARIEVLRGPQGTLFGRNATAGAISLVTSAPTGERGGSQLFSKGNYGAFRSRTVLNLPEFGPLSVKLAYLHDEIDGDTRNAIAGQTIDLSPRDPSFGTLRYAKRLGMRNDDAFQASARLDLDPLTIDYRFDYTDSRTTARAQQLLITLDDGAGQLAQGLLAFQPLTGGITNLSPDRLNPVADATSVARTVTQGHNLSVTYNVSDAITLKSITGYRKLNQRPNIYDLAASGGLRFSLAQFYALLSGNVAGVVGAPAPGANDNINTLIVARTQRQKQFSEELQLIYDGERFDLTAGLFYFNEKAPTTDISGVFQPIVGGVAPAFPDIVLPNGTRIPGLDSIFGSGVTKQSTNNDSYAGYIQGTYHISPFVDVTGGIRYTKDVRRTELISVSGSNGAILPPGTYKSSFRKANFTGIIAYHPNEDLNFYAKVATGYVSGGVVSAIPFDPETLTSYEIGAKTQLFDNRLRANVAVFYQDYKDLQVQGFANGVLRFDNAGAARIPGVEVELTALPTRGLTLSTGFSYTDFSYRQYLQRLADGVLADVAPIARPPYYSKYTLSLGATYDFPELANGWAPFVRIDPRYRSGSYLTGFPPGITSAQFQQIVLGNVPPRVAAQESANRIGGFWIVDGRIGIAKISFGNVRGSLSLYGQNILDKRQVEFGASVISLTGQFNRARTYGVELKADF